MTQIAQIDSYLASLRATLGPINLGDREEIVREIAAHIRDSAEAPGATVDAVLARLGPAGKLAAQYRDGMLIRRASQSISPLVLLRGALRLASKGVFGIFVLATGALGYLFGGGLVLSGLLKPIFPIHTGVWFDTRYNKFVTSGTLLHPPAPPAHEVLGIWYTLIALTLGSLLILATTFIIRTSLRVSQRWQENDALIRTVQRVMRKRDAYRVSASDD